MSPVTPNRPGSAAGGPPAGTPGERPEFMELLGLLPPYSPEDVHKAYKALSLKVHPDRGGSTAEFMKLQEAYDKAQEYVRFRKGRRDWMANLVEPYARQQEVVQEVQRRNGKVSVEKIDWMQQSFGDFATLTERVRSVDLSDSQDADGFLEFMGGFREHLRYLNELDLSGSDLTDVGLKLISTIESLKRLNLSRTKVTLAGLPILAKLKELQALNLSGLSLGFWDRRSVRRQFPNVAIEFG